MLCSPVLSVVLVLAFVASTTIAYPADKQTVVEVITINDISKLKDLPRGTELIRLNQNRNARGGIIYTLGQRASNDKLVSQASDSKFWDTEQNVQLSLQYPISGTGAVITFVQIDVNQSSNIGQAYVVLGGIGQRKISIIVESTNTKYFSFVSQIWGI